MKIVLNADQLSSLTSFLKNFPDSEALSEREYVLDLYDHDPPISLDICLAKNGIFVDGAVELLFDEEMDGWYIGSRIEDAQAILDALEKAGAFPNDAL